MSVKGDLENALVAWRKAKVRHEAKVSAVRLAEAELGDAGAALEQAVREVAAHAELSKSRATRYIDLGGGLLYKLNLIEGFSDHFSITIIEPER